MGTQKMHVTPLVLTFCVGFSLAQDASNKKAAVELDGNDGAGPANARSKRLFFVSTTSSTSTLITAFTCYISAAALVTCKKRRKRSYLEESIDEQPQSLVEEAIDPARIQSLADSDESAFLEAGMNEADAKQREGKFLLYWLTTTSVVTETSFSATQSLASIHCTPSSYVMTNCASLG